MIVEVDRDSLPRAASVHAASWKDSHRVFCSPEFIALHSPEHQQAYLLDKMRGGSRIWLLVEREPVGLVSVNGNLIEDLYVLPEMQNRGYGTRLLRFAMAQCTGVPTLWILENNRAAARLYRRLGFRETGRVNAITDKLAEIEFSRTEPGPEEPGNEAAGDPS